MTVTKTVDIPASRRLTIDVPREIPAGSVVLIFTTVTDQKLASNRKPISQYFGILSPDTYGDGVGYQRAIRDEWDD